MDPIRLLYRGVLLAIGTPEGHTTPRAEVELKYKGKFQEGGEEEKDAHFVQEVSFPANVETLRALAPWLGKDIVVEIYIRPGLQAVAKKEEAADG